MPTSKGEARFPRTNGHKPLIDYAGINDTPPGPKPTSTAPQGKPNPSRAPEVREAQRNRPVAWMSTFCDMQPAAVHFPAHPALASSLPRSPAGFPKTMSTKDIYDGGRLQSGTGSVAARLVLCKSHTLALAEHCPGNDQSNQTGKGIMRHVRRTGTKGRRRRGALTFEWILLISLLVIGIIGGLSAVRNALICELTDLAQCIQALNICGCNNACDPTQDCPDPNANCCQGDSWWCGSCGGGP